MKKATIYLFLLVFCLATVLLIGCASIPKTKAQTFVDRHVNDAIKYYGEPIQKFGASLGGWELVGREITHEGITVPLEPMVGPPDSKIYCFLHHLEDPKLRFCVIAFLVDRKGNVLKIHQIECK